MTRERQKEKKNPVSMLKWKPKPRVNFHNKSCAANSACSRLYVMATRPNSSDYHASSKKLNALSHSSSHPLPWHQPAAAAVCIMIKSSPAARHWNTVSSFTASKSPVRPRDICWKTIPYQASSANFWGTSGACEDFEPSRRPEESGGGSSNWPQCVDTLCERGDQQQLLPQSLAARETFVFGGRGGIS